MSRLKDPTDTVVILQNRIFRLDRENQRLRIENNSILNRVAAAEAAAKSAVASFNEQLYELERLKAENAQLRAAVGE